MPLEFNPAHIRIGIIGLGYVGLPLAVEFARKYPVVGFDVKQSRIEELRRDEDSTREVDPAELQQVSSPPAKGWLRSGRGGGHRPAIPCRHHGCRLRCPQKAIPLECVCSAPGYAYASL